MVGKVIIMSWEVILDKDVQAFIAEHENDDVATLALKKPPSEDWPYPLILDQIKVRQKAVVKTPKLRDTRSFVFPPYFLYEQASSEACANHKSLITKDFTGEVFVDLTAGCGVDSFALAKNFKRGVLIEKNSRNAEILRHNAGLFEGDDRAFFVHEGTAESYVKDTLLAKEKKVSLIYIDPQRREDSGGKKGLYDFELCSPNILELLPDLKKVAGAVLIKTAPFLDIDKALEQIQSRFSESPRIGVHVLQWRGECKEVLYLLDFSGALHEDGALITAVDLDDKGEVVSRIAFRREEEREARASYALPQIGDYIYESGPAFQKAGGFKYLSEHFGVAKLHEHTHLYVCKTKKNDFPGKEYEIIGIFPPKAGSLPVKCADLAVRNFPQSVALLRKKLKLRDGGKHRIFATTTHDNKHFLILCNKSQL